MKQIFLAFYLCAFSVFSSLAQDAIVKGRVIDAKTTNPINAVQISIQNSIFNTLTNEDGLFSITGTNLPQGEQILIVNKLDYLQLKLPIVIQNGTTVDIDPILLEIDLSEIETQIGIISLTDNELNTDESASFNISGLLQASNDVFLQAASFDFSATFFRPRGLDNENGKVLINGIEMNKQFNGRPHVLEEHFLEFFY